MQSRFAMWLTSVAAVTVAGGLPAAAAPAWCQQIADGLFCAQPEAAPPHFCGTKPISVALADGFADNAWRQMTTAVAINEASRCPNVTSWTHTDGQGNTQKAISDIEGLAARGINAIVVYADGGPAMLASIRDAYKQGSAIVPYIVKVGGKEGVDYTAFIDVDFRSDGVIWGKWLASTLKGKGTVAYFSGPPGDSEGIEKSQALHEVFKEHPGIKWIGQEPYEVTNYDPSIIAKDEVALIARYPEIDGLSGELTMPLLTSGAFQRAGRDLPVIAGEDANGIGCEWEKLHANGAKSSFQFYTTSSLNWMVRSAMQWAIASAAGGKVDEPLAVTDTKGRKHLADAAGSKTVVNFAMDDSLNGIVFCDPSLPASAGNGTSLTTAQTLGALKGGL
jgi:ribose transport system substrate-binding protein